MKTIVLLTILISLNGCYSREPEITGQEGKFMPSFKLLLSDSTTYIDTKNILSGRPTALFYFGPHCPHSKTQMAEIIEDMDILKDIQFYIFTTSSYADMKEFYETYHLNKYQNIIVGIDYNRFFGPYFETPGVPYMAIYGKDKKLNEAFIGTVYGKQINRAAFK